MDHGANTLRPGPRRPTPAVIKFRSNESCPLILKQAGFLQGAGMTYMFWKGSWKTLLFLLCFLKKWEHRQAASIPRSGAIKSPLKRQRCRRGNVASR